MTFPAEPSGIAKQLQYGPHTQHVENFPKENSPRDQYSFYISIYTQPDCTVYASACIPGTGCWGATSCCSNRNFSPDCCLVVIYLHLHLTTWFVSHYITSAFMFCLFQYLRCVGRDDVFRSVPVHPGNCWVSVCDGVDRVQQRQLHNSWLPWPHGEITAAARCAAQRRVLLLTTGLCLPPSTPNTPRRQSPTQFTSHQTMCVCMCDVHTCVFIPETCMGMRSPSVWVWWRIDLSRAEVVGPQVRSIKTMGNLSWEQCISQEPSDWLLPRSRLPWWRIRS